MLIFRFTNIIHLSNVNREREIEKFNSEVSHHLSFITAESPWRSKMSGEKKQPFAILSDPIDRQGPRYFRAVTFLPATFKPPVASTPSINKSGWLSWRHRRRWKKEKEKKKLCPSLLFLYSPGISINSRRISSSSNSSSKPASKLGGGNEVLNPAVCSAG